MNIKAVVRVVLLAVVVIAMVLASPMFAGNIPYMLGVLYDNGYGVSQNYSEAAKWYRKAAEQGNTKAPLFLALKYAMGDGVAPNYVKACMWITIASAQNEQQARESLNLIEEFMTQEGIARGQYLAYIWMLQHSEFFSHPISPPASNPYRGNLL